MELLLLPLLLAGSLVIAATQEGHGEAGLTRERRAPIFWSSPPPRPPPAGAKTTPQQLKNPSPSSPTQLPGPGTQENSAGELMKTRNQAAENGKNATHTEESDTNQQQVEVPGNHELLVVTKIKANGPLDASGADHEDHVHCPDGVCNNENPGLHSYTLNVFVGGKHYHKSRAAKAENNNK